MTGEGYNSYCQTVCYFLKNTTIPWEYYSHYPLFDYKNQVTLQTGSIVDSPA